ncbi:P-loop NTPase fold protein [Lysobacter sp. LF1]|uniref:P-loop NTPase fold protein n=1 Tax=Lysobacter stagni TaxID=3045172 RepID=A0ABT6XCY1_9GAMM|nr:P-loop NTPase fold protein [Lysobacter sp. LF1]MDI9237783.1 P-loop NTPase fold protein [Lysobacter sp. LF1]
MSSPNDHIELFLDHYYKRPIPPGYAVLVKGRWGAGKTWFMKRSLAQLERDGGKVLHVSLNGITSVDAIEGEIFRLLHPVLASKGMALAGKVLKGLLRATIKVDLDGNGRDDASVAPQLPEIKIPDYLTNTEGFVLVFDDIERCSIPIAELLGYINHFVEHSDLKVILVANEDEIIRQEEIESATDRREHRAYLRIKEKLIGKTFEIEPEIDAAARAFVGEFADGPAKKFFKQNDDRIREVFAESKYQNLRHLRLALFDLEDLLNHLAPDIRDSSAVVAELISRYLALSFEIKSGSMVPGDIRDLSRDGYLRSLANDEGARGHYARVSKKYSGIDFVDEPVSNELWVAIFDKGVVDVNAIEQSIRNSRYFSSEQQPSWVRLWHASSLTDEEISELLPQVAHELKNGLYTRAGEVMHASCVLFWLSDLEIHKESRREILDTAKLQLDRLRAVGRLSLDQDVLRNISMGAGYGGLGFHDRGSLEYRELVAHWSNSAEAERIDQFPRRSEELLTLMNTDSGAFYRALVVTNDGDSRFYDTPLLKFIAPSSFVDQYLAIAPSDKQRVGMTFRRRYEFESSNRMLVSEAIWLGQVSELLKARAANLRGTMVANNLVDLAKLMADAKTALESMEEVGGRTDAGADAARAETNGRK